MLCQVFLVDFCFLFQNVNPIPSAFVVTHMLPGDRKHTEQFPTESGHGSFTICSAGWSVWSLLPLPWESALSHLLTPELSSHKNSENLPLSHTEGLPCSSLSPCEFLFVFPCECFAVFWDAKNFQSSKKGINQTSFISNFVFLDFVFCNSAQLKGLLHSYRVL